MRKKMRERDRDRERHVREYIHVYMYVNIYNYMHICLYVYAYIFICIQIYLFVYINIYIFVYMYLHTSLYTCDVYILFFFYELWGKAGVRSAFFSGVEAPYERWGAGVETQKNAWGEIGGWGRVPFNEPYAPSLSTIYDGA